MLYSFRFDTALWQHSHLFISMLDFLPSNVASFTFLLNFICWFQTKTPFYWDHSVFWHLKILFHRWNAFIYLCEAPLTWIRLHFKDLFYWGSGSGPGMKSLHGQLYASLPQQCFKHMYWHFLHVGYRMKRKNLKIPRLTFLFFHNTLEEFLYFHFCW